MIIQYVRDQKRNPIGAVVALDSEKIGFSLCHPRDKWNKKIGLEVAKGRAEQYEVKDIKRILKKKIPDDKFVCLYSTIVSVIERAKKYYK